MADFTIIDNKKVDLNITFIRINPTNINITLKDIFRSLSDLSWISRIDPEYMREGFQVRAEATVRYLSNRLLSGTTDQITKDSGEYIVSELARQSLIQELHYSDIPLAELIKEKRSGNPGFDFYAETIENIILFGESKYVAGRNSYGRALKQIVQFNNEKRDIADLPDIGKFCSNISLEKVIQNQKGYVAAFSSVNTPTSEIINGILANEDFKLLRAYNELVCVAINI
jgi:hypothetical protein